MAQLVNPRFSPFIFYHLKGEPPQKKTSIFQTIFLDARSTLTDFMGAERRRIASLLTTATMVLNTNMAVSDVQVLVVVIHPGTPGGGNFSGEIYGEIEG